LTLENSHALLRSSLKVIKGADCLPKVMWGTSKVWVHFPAGGVKSKDVVVECVPSSGRSIIQLQLYI